MMFKKERRDKSINMRVDPVIKKEFDEIIHGRLKQGIDKKPQTHARISRSLKNYLGDEGWQLYKKKAIFSNMPDLESEDLE